MTDPWNTDQPFSELYFDEDEYVASLAPLTSAELSSVGGYGEGLDPFAGEQSEMMLGVSGESVNQPQGDRAAYIAAFGDFSQGQLSGHGKAVEDPGFFDPVPLGNSLSSGRPGQPSQPDAGDSARVKLPLTGKRTMRPQSVYAAALDALPEGELPERGRTVKVPGHDDPILIGSFLNNLRYRGIVGARVEPVLEAALGRRGLVLVPDPADPTRVKLPLTGKRTMRPQSVYAAALDACPEGKLPKSGETVKVSGYAIPVPIGDFLKSLRYVGVVEANVGQVLVDALGRRGLVLVPDPADPTRVKLPPAAGDARHSRYAAALDACPEGKLPKSGETVKVSGCAIPVPIGDFLKNLRYVGVVEANVGQVLVDALGRHGLVLEPDPADPTRVKLPPTGKRIVWPPSVYAAALNAFPAYELPKSGETVKVSGCAIPVPIGDFLRSLRYVGVVEASVGQVLVDALGRRGLVLEPDPADPTRVKLPPTGKRIMWPHSVYAAALDACPEGKLPKSGETVKVSGCAIPVPIGDFLKNLRSVGVVEANVGQVLVDALGRRGLVLEPDPANPTRVKLPPTGKHIMWPHSVYAAALDACPEGKLPKSGETVKVSG
ncbi:hypothetical protein ABT336_24590, partial [Micromonospora sp. NPDC000207]|uniref:hypothetical protein n=1 Tax=Micromonospora sp. NPDC000207 TaxID=3154246 RepID=UPI003332745A